MKPETLLSLCSFVENRTGTIEMGEPDYREAVLHLCAFVRLYADGIKYRDMLSRLRRFHRGLSLDAAARLVELIPEVFVNED